MKPNCLIRVIFLLVLASAALTAQVVRQGDVPIPLRNWATPLYWQANQVDAAAQGLPVKAAPQLQFSANAVSTNALTFIAITPCRLVDTRGASAGFNGISPFSGPSIPALGTITIPVQSTTEASTNTTPAPCGVIPTIAQAYSFNLTVVPPAAGAAVDYVSLWPAGSAQPFVSTLDDPQGAIVSNAVIVPAGPTSGPGYGGVSVYNHGPATTDVIIDMNGYFAAPSDLNGNTAIGTGTLTSNAPSSDGAGSYNTAVGYQALLVNTTGSSNTASGFEALQDNTTGSGNTATGYEALHSNTTGGYNTATGIQALEGNTTGSANTATGFNALLSNTTGYDNTATGQAALASNTTGYTNMATGQAALASNTTGSGNTAVGANALESNSTGVDNTAIGLNALLNDTTCCNTAVGAGALLNNNAGTANEAFGISALAFNTSGSNNIAIGLEASYNTTTGSNNIGIGTGAALNVSGGNSNNIHIGSQGAAGDSATIRLGTEGTQTSAYIAGISGMSASGGAAVYVTSSGQLGTVLSSRRFKEHITDMGDTSSKLLQLRPVNFFYKPQYDDGSHLLQYGLIAEEVAKVYPEMVAYDKDGQILTVKYQLLAPMLLNEVQKQNARLQTQVQRQQEENRKLEDRLAALEALLSSQTPAAARPANSQ